MYYCFSHLYYICLLIFFWVAQTKKSFKRKNSVGSKCCQLKALRILLIFINKTTGSDNRHFFFNTLKNENKEEFLTYSTYCTLEQIGKKYITEATIPGCSIQSSFKQVWVILQVYSITAGWHKLKPWTNYPKKKWYTMGTSPFPQL